MKINLIVMYMFCLSSFIGVAQTKDLAADEFPFDMTFDVQTIDVDKFCLTFSLELEEGQYAISPFSEDGFYLPITISWLTPDVNFVQGRLEEIPKSVYEYDNIVDKQVRFVKQNTSYEQYFDWKVADNASIKGLIELLVEPACIPFDVNFELVSKNGNISVTKIATVISSEYKR